MAHSYVETDELIKDVLSNEIKDDDAESIATIGRLIESVSSFVDRYTRRPDGYFMALAEDSDPVVRRVRGTGRNFIQIGRHVDGTVTVAGIETNRIYSKDQFVFFADVSAGFGNDEIASSGSLYLFQSGGLYEVSARYGFAETPPDIVLAVKQIVQHIWDRGKGVFGQVSPTGFVIERDMPLTARTFLDGWVKREFEVN